MKFKQEVEDLVKEGKALPFNEDEFRAGIDKLTHDECKQLVHELLKAAMLNQSFSCTLLGALKKRELNNNLLLIIQECFSYPQIPFHLMCRKIGHNIIKIYSPLYHVVESWRFLYDISESPSSVDDYIVNLANEFEKASMN